MPMSKQVVYLMSGRAHLPYLVVSLYSLRKHWHGPVIVHAWEESVDIVKRISQDERLNIECVGRVPKYRRSDGVGSNAQFIDKIRLMQTLDTEVSIYLDADTMVNNPLDELFDFGYAYGFCATQFNDWKSNGRIPRKRISRLVGVEGIDQFAVELAMNNPYPSVNGGVFSCCPDSPSLEMWYEWTMKVRNIFIADETVLHAMVPLVLSVAGVGECGKYNISPKFKPDGLDNEDVVIWHFHGDSCVRQNKSPLGVWLWWHVYQECMRKNIGFMQEWRHLCYNKYLKRVEETPEGHCRYCGLLSEHHSKCPMGTEHEH